MISRLFISRPIFATVCSLIIMLAGAVAIPTLPIARYPELSPPSVTVSAFYNGANAQAVESAVTTPLEQVINGVEGMMYMTSSSTNTGFCQISITFEIGRDPDLAAVDVQNRVNQALGRMPPDVRTNGITVTISPRGVATFGARCTRCPLRSRCTTNRKGRLFTVGDHDQLLAAARADWRAGIGTDTYRQWRPMVERSIAWLVANGHRRLRYRGVERNRLALTIRAAVINLRRLLNLGLTHTTNGWSIAT